MIPSIFCSRNFLGKASHSDGWVVDERAEIDILSVITLNIDACDVSCFKALARVSTSEFDGGNIVRVIAATSKHTIQNNVSICVSKTLFNTLHTNMWKAGVVGIVHFIVFLWNLVF